MTETATHPRTEPPIPHPTQFLLDLIVAFLTPMFLSISNGNIAYARLAAIETVNAYRAETQADLITIAQVIAFGLAALGSLSLSMTDTLSPPLILRLRANANACHRSAEQNRRALQQNRREAAQPEHNETPVNEVAILDEIAAIQQQTQPQNPQPAAPTDHQAQWAAAVSRVAAEYTTDLANLSPEQRRAATFKAAMLNSCARDLLNGPPIPRMTPGELAASLRLAR